MAVHIQSRRGTAAQWTAANPVLAEGELGVESDTVKIKIGNGTTAWNALPYLSAAVAGGAWVAWTPTITASTGTPTTVTTANCVYSKVGRQVTVKGAVTVTNKGTAAGELRVSLPFTAAAGAIACGSATLANLGTMQNAYIGGGAAFATLMTPTFTTLWTDGNTPHFTITYESAT